MTIKTLASTTAILVAGASTAYAGGLDRSTFSSSILFEEGTYAEVSLGFTDPDVSPAGSSVSVAKNFRTVKAGIKFDVSDKLSFAITSNNNPIGADIDYTGVPLGGANAQGFINAQDLSFLAKYKITDNFSVFGGAKRQSVDATADLTVAGGTLLSFDDTTGVGFIGGVAYEKPEIALRVAFSIESRIGYSLTTRNLVALPGPIPVGSAIGTTTSASPKAFTLEFQTGVAPNTLVFGSIRHAKWSDANINVLGSPLTTFQDTNAYNLGVARKFNDNIVGFVSFSYEPSEGTVSSPFAPTDGIKGISIGGQYSFAKGFKVAGSISHSKRGDTTTSLGQTFSGSTVTTYGIKLSKSF